MSILAGTHLNTKEWFSNEHASPLKEGSSVTLTIGKIIDSNGREVEATVLEPGHMLQVISAQVFKLPKTVTGHVTYKTSLTRDGIWALTVGIVDPEWNGPVSTTLLNFSKLRHRVELGDEFLRVSFFEHAPVTTSKNRTVDSFETYTREVRQKACGRFPSTFLDKVGVSKEAGKTAIDKMEQRGLVWIACIAAIFAIFQIIAVYVPPFIPGWQGATKDEIQELERRIDEMENEISQ